MGRRPQEKVPLLVGGGGSVKTWPTGSTQRGMRILPGKREEEKGPGHHGQSSCLCVCPTSQSGPAIPDLVYPFDWSPLIANLLFGRSFRLS